jgi:cobalamin biosynthesis protein CobD/CbiB
LGLLALLFALLIEQARPLRAGHWVDLQFAWIADWVRQHTDAGTRGHGLMGWCVLVGLSVTGVGLVHWGLGSLHATTQFAFDVLVLYGTIGFRRFSQAFSEIQVALAAGDTAGARESLTRWIRELDPGFVASTAPVSEVCRVAIAHALVAAHRHVFAPIFWYLVLPGPIGPVLYRAVETLAQRWRDPKGGEAYGYFAVQAYRVLDWLPLRLTAAGFAIVGNFEDAAYCWRGARSRQSAGAWDPQRALVLAAGGGAIGVRIADPELEADWARSELGFDWSGAVADPSALRSAVGLVWRAVVLWLAFFGIVTVSSWVG